MRFCRVHHFISTAVISITLAFILSLPSSPISATAASAVISVSGPEQPVNPGARFTVNIIVQPNNAIVGTQFNLSFNPSQVSVISVTEGNLFKQGGAHSYFSPGVIDNNAGTITGASGTITDPGQTVSASGTFAVITMTAASTSGTCPLTLSKVIAGDLNAQPLPINTVNGNISIGTNGVNQPPVLNSIGDKTVNAGSLLSIIISAADPEGDSLTYSASNLPSGANFDPLSRVFSWTPGANQIGTFSNLHFEVTDSKLSDSESITITVTSASAGGGGGGFGGGGGGGGAPAPAPTATGITNRDGLFNQTVSVKSDDGLAQIVIDQGIKVQTKDGSVVNKISIIAVESPATTQEQTIIGGTVYDLGPDGAAFDQPISLTFTYNPALLPVDTNENDLTVATWDPAAGKWINLESQVNLTNHTITASVNHFSMYTVLALKRPTVSITVDLPVQPVVVEPADATPDTSQPSSPDTNTADLNGSSAPQAVTTPTPATMAAVVPVTPADISNSAPGSPTLPAEKVFSLSLLAEIIGGAFILIAATILFIQIRRRHLLGRGQN